jgi:type I restriction enzyme S subunit
MSPYPRYKEGPAKWVGDLPEHWAVERVKYSLSEKRPRAAPALPAGAISFGRVIAKDGERLSEETRATYQEVLAGEYLINPINLNYDLISLRTALSSIDVVVSPAYIVAKPDISKLLPAFGNYLLYVFDIRHMKSLGAGVRQTIGFKDIGNCYWALPPIDEQEAISSFLDRETGRIDRLNEKKGRFIELLQEKRTALITAALTGALGTDVLKVETRTYWAPSIPQDWSITPFRMACWYQEGPGILAIDFKEEGVPLLRVSGVQGKYASTTGCNFLDPQKVEKRWKHFRLTLGDLLISASATVGTITEVGPETVGAVPYTGIIRLRPWQRVTKEYLSYFLGSSIFLEQVNLMKQGSTIQHFGPTHLSRVRIPLPPLEEQVRITAELDSRTDRITLLIAKTERSIELLKEHRSALITAAVTGKIDVRGLAAKNMKAAA